MVSVTDFTSKQQSEVMFGTCVGLAALATTHDGLCFVGGADSAIKTFDLKTRNVLDDFVVEVFDEEVELTCFTVFYPHRKMKHRSYLIFGTKSGLVCFLPILQTTESVDRRKTFKTEDVSVIFKGTRPIRDIKTLSRQIADNKNIEMLAIGTSNSSIKLVNLSKLDNQEFNEIVSINLGKTSGIGINAGPMKQIEFLQQNESIQYLLSASCDGVFRIWDVTPLMQSEWNNVGGNTSFEERFKLIKEIENMFEKDKKEDVENLDKCCIVSSPDAKHIAVGGDKMVRIVSTPDWSKNENFGEGVFSSKISCLQFSPNGKYLFATDTAMKLAIFDFVSKKSLYQMQFQDKVQRLSFSRSLPGIVALLDNGDFWIIDDILKGDNKKLTAGIREHNRSKEIVSSSAVEENNLFEANSGLDLDIEKRREEIRRTFNNESDLNPQDDQMVFDGNRPTFKDIQIDEVARKVFALQEKDFARKLLPKIRVLQPNSTYFEEFHRSKGNENDDRLFGRINRSCYLDWNHVGKIIKRKNEIEIKFANINRKSIRIDTYEINRDYTVGCITRNSVLLCTQVTNNSPYAFSKKSKSRYNSIESNPVENGLEPSNQGSVLQKAFDEAEKLENDNGLLEIAQVDDSSSKKDHSIIFFKSLIDSSNGYEWSLELDGTRHNISLKENVVLCCCGVDFVCVVTDEMNCRIIRHSGLQEATLKLSHIPITAIAHENYLFMIFHGFNTFCYEWYIVTPEGQADEKMKLLSRGQLGIETNLEGQRCVSALSWAGFTSNGIPTYFASSGELYALISKLGFNWIKIFDTPKDCLIWPISIQGARLLTLKRKLTSQNRQEDLDDKLSCWPKVDNKNLVEIFDLTLDIAGFDPSITNKVGSLKYKLEEKALKMSLFLSNGAYDSDVDTILLKHIMLNVKLNKWNRVLGTLRRIDSADILNRAKGIIQKASDDKSYIQKVQEIIRNKQSSKTSSTHLPIHNLDKRRLLETKFEQSQTPLGFTLSSLSPQEEKVNPGMEGDVTPKLSRKSTFSKEARDLSLKKQRLF